MGKLPAAAAGDGVSLCATGTVFACNGWDGENEATCLGTDGGSEGARVRSHQISELEIVEHLDVSLLG